MCIHYAQHAYMCLWKPQCIGFCRTRVIGSCELPDKPQDLCRSIKCFKLLRPFFNTQTCLLNKIKHFLEPSVWNPCKTSVKSCVYHAMTSATLYINDKKDNSVSCSTMWLQINCFIPSSFNQKMLMKFPAKYRSLRIGRMNHST